MKKIRCAIYTRKSAEEGLEQDAFELVGVFSDVRCEPSLADTFRTDVRH